MDRMTIVRLKDGPKALGEVLDTLPSGMVVVKWRTTVGGTPLKAGLVLTESPDDIEVHDEPIDFQG